MSNSLVVTSNMASKRVAKKDTVKSSTREPVEKVSVNLPFYADTQLFIKKGMKLTWQEIKDIFARDFKEDKEDWPVYIIIHRLGLHKVACRYLTFPSTNIIHWIVLHTNLDTMTMRSASEIDLSTFWVESYQ